MDVTSSASADQLQEASQLAPVLRDPAQLLQMYREHDRASISCQYSHISPLDQKPVQKAVFLDRYRQDAKTVGSPGHGFKPESRGKRGEISRGMPSSRSLANLGFLLGNCEPVMRSMITATMSDYIHAICSVALHKSALQAFLKRLARRGWRVYVWVREFQFNGSVHWHIFIPEFLGTGLNHDVSIELSKAFAEYYSKHVGCKLCSRGAYHQCETGGGFCGEALRKMVDPHDDRDEHIGCVHAEGLHGGNSAAARYSQKEGCKRFQKEPSDRRWLGPDAGAWYRCSRGIVCPVFEYGYMVGEDDVTRCKFETDDGFKVDMPYRIQYGMGVDGDRKPD